MLVKEGKMDVHNLLFERLTKIAFHGLNISEVEGFSEVDGDTVCSICSREVSEQPPQYGSIAFSGKNSYKQDVTYCVCCSAFFQNNPEVLGIEKPKAPNTSQKFGMLSGSGMFIELNTDRTILFMPEKSANKLPDSTLSLLSDVYGIELVKITQFNQLTYLSDLELNFPALWVNNLGKKTTSLVSNLKMSNSDSALWMITDDEVNSSSEMMYKIDLTKLVQFAKNLKACKGKAKFKKAIIDLCNGRVTPAQVGELVQKEPEFLPLIQALPKDPHLRIEFFRLAEKVA